MMRIPLFFKHALAQVLKSGRVTVKDAYGEMHVIGPHGDSVCTLWIKNPRLHLSLFLNPQLKLGEAYTAGSIEITEGNIEDLLDLLQRDLGMGIGIPLHNGIHAFRRLLRRVAQHNPVARAKRNAHFHYDIPFEVYRTFLDKDLQYSCAYFAGKDDPLELAQEQKKKHIASKLLLAPGQKILDIGSGWGGLSLYLSEISGANVTGVTLSEEQLKVSQNRCRQKGCSQTVRFNLQDYRQIQEKFDRIVSVGMLEHVGAPHLSKFFSTISSCLKDDGLALIHFIGRSDGPGVTNPWIEKYIFPGGYAPALSEVLPHIERAGLYLTDLEVLRLHYAETLKHWRERARARADEIKARCGEDFFRMWEFYLAGSEMAFRHQGQVVFQLQLSKNVDAVPMTRDYMIDWERNASNTNIDQKITAIPLAS